MRSGGGKGKERGKRKGEGETRGARKTRWKKKQIITFSTDFWPFLNQTIYMMFHAPKPFYVYYFHMWISVDN